MNESYETLSLDRPSDHVLRVTLDRPSSANALSTQMGLDLRDVWTSLYVDQQDVRCVVVTGRGERAFCAGGDLKERNGMTDAQWKRQHAIYEQAIKTMMDCPIPVLGAINGAAYAGGLEIALCCDFLYAAPNARFAMTEVTLGIMPGAGGTQNLPRAVGVRRAKEIILTGVPFTVEDALAWGLINRICPDGTLMDTALETATRIAGNAPISTRQAKKSIDVATQVDLKTGYAFEIEAYNIMVPTQDRLEGIRSFNEKRRPVFKGE